MPTIDVTNPGLVNVVLQGDGLLTVDQPVTVSPSSNAGLGASVVAENPYGARNNVTSTNPGTTNVVTETFGLGLPRNVFV
jgi:hypothetical protein